MIRSMTTIAAMAACCGLAAAQFNVNLMTNGDFEAGNELLLLPNDWNAFAGATGFWSSSFNHTPGGAYSLEFPMTGGFKAWQPDVENRPVLTPVAPDGNGGPVTLSMWYNMPSEVSVLVLGGKIDWFTANGQGLGGTGDLNITDRNTNGEWRQMVWTNRANGDLIVPPLGATRARVFIQTFDPGTPSGTVYFDDVELVQASGDLPCLADLFEDGILDINDILTFAQAFNDEAEQPGPNDDRAVNGGFETADMMDPTQPMGWNCIRCEATGYDVGGMNGAPAAVEGTRLVSLRGSPEGGFVSWLMDVEDPEAVIAPNSTNPLTFSFMWNIPNAGVSTQILGAKVEWIALNEEGLFETFLGGTGDIIITQDLSPTNGWQPFQFTVQPANIPPAAEAARVLVFSFSPDGTPSTGEVYFDDVKVFQAGVPSRVADQFFDGVLDINDILVFANNFNAGCP